MLKRYTVRCAADDAEGSVFACSREHARESATDLGLILVRCEGSDGVDEMTVCDAAGCDE